MPKNFNIKQIDVSEKKLRDIGFDNTYLKEGIKKHSFVSFKIDRLSCAQANILKQTAISVGTDCAVHKEVITGNIEFSDCVLSGSINQINKISEKLKKQPFKLKILGKELSDVLTRQLSPLEIRKKTIDWKYPLIMGILNVTPDSFSDGGKYLTLENAYNKYLQLTNDCVDIIDIGGESTRPMAQEITADEEIERVLPLIEKIRNKDNTTIISIDTRNAKTAEKALLAGVDIINDVSGLEWDKNMTDIVKQYNCPIIINHCSKYSTNVHKDIIDEIYSFFVEKINCMSDIGINQNQIILDVGIGFGKTLEENYEIIKRINEFKTLNYPIMTGHSRKSFIQNTLNSTDNETLDFATLAISQTLINNGVNILRVHDTKNHKNLIKLNSILADRNP